MHNRIFKIRKSIATTQPKPRVSIVMPVYFQNQAYLRRALQSCFHEEDLACVDVEVLLVVDDGQDYSDYDTDERIKILTTGGVGVGPSRARNVALNAATGDLVALLDSDDYFLPGKLAELAPKALQYGIAYDNLRIDLGGDDPQQSTLAGARESGVQAMAFFLALNNPLSGIYRRDVLGPTRFLDDVRFSEDSAFNYEVLARNDGIAYFDAQPRHVYVIHDASLSHQDDGVQLAEVNYARIVEHFKRVPGIEDARRTDILERYAMKRDLNLRFGAWLGLPGNGSRTFQEFLQSPSGA